MSDTWTPPPGLDIVDTAEIAARCHVSNVAVRQWVARGHLPAPDGTIGRSPWWHWQRVAALSPMVARYVAEAKRAAEAEVTPAPDEYDEGVHEAAETWRAAHPDLT